MKTLFALLILGTAVFADSTSNFEVKEIDAATVKALHNADERLDQATEILQTAQRAMSAAKADRDAIELKIKSDNGEVSIPCQWGSGASFATGRFRAVEIRGKYALITSGVTMCSPTTTVWASGTTSTSSIVCGDSNCSYTGNGAITGGTVTGSPGEPPSLNQ